MNAVERADARHMDPNASEDHIKAQTVRLQYQAEDGNIYQLNLMDTLVTSIYEVSRSLAAVRVLRLSTPARALSSNPRKRILSRCTMKLFRSY